MREPENPVSLRGLDLDRYLADPALRQSYVTPMFDLIATRYDRFTRVFSLGMDRRWKRTLVGLAAEAVPRNARVLDVATGTGDLAFALARQRPDVKVIATDVSSRMLALARLRNAEQPRSIEIASGNIASLPFPDASIDVVTAGYALRNTPDWRASIAELARVIRPSGHLLTLDFYRPAFTPWRHAFLGWLGTSGRFVGWLWHREPMAYGYIARSISHFTTTTGFSAALEAAGFTTIACHHYLGGGIAIHHAVRRQAGFPALPPLLQPNE